MSWSTITASEVLEELTPSERSSLEAVQGASTQLAAILSRVVKGVRGAVAAGGYEVSSTANTIPDQLRSEVVAMARWRWLISFPQLKTLQTEARKAAHDDAQARLDRVAEGKLAVESPTAGANPASGSWNSENKLPPRSHPSPRPGPQGDNAYANPDGPEDTEAD